MITSNYDEPVQVATINGEVVWSGPDGIRKIITPQVARLIAERLIAAAAEAELHAPPPSEAMQREGDGF